MMRNLFVYSFAIGVGLSGCGGSNNSHNDAPVKDDAAIDAPGSGDAMEPPLTVQADEGGEVRLEWIQTKTNVQQSRATAFFYKSETPDMHTFPSFPGCVDVTKRDTWPFAQGAITSLDVGDVIIHNSGGDTELTRDATGLNGGTATVDFLGRPHDLWWKKVVSANTDPTNMADGNLLPPDEAYNILFTGSSEWPPQSFEGSTGNASYMPSAWSPVSPVNTATAQIPDADLVLTFQADASTKLPAGYVVNTFVAFTPPAGSTFVPPTPFVGGPVVICQFEGTPTTITIPKAMVEIVRTYSTVGGVSTAGTFTRQHLTHHLQELTDGTPRMTADRKRIDMLTVWCFNSPWMAM